MTESKKLHSVFHYGHVTSIHGLDEASALAALKHDARLAHEMQEIIRKQDEALTHALSALGKLGANMLGGPHRAEWEMIRAALAAAAPYLED